MFVGVCAHPSLCGGCVGRGVYTPECGWGLVVPGMRKNRRACIECHSSEWPPCARDSKDLAAAVMDGCSPTSLPTDPPTAPPATGLACLSPSISNLAGEMGKHFSN